MSTIAFALLWNVVLATILAVLVQVVSRLKMLQQRPRLTHALWLLVLAKLITPPVIPLPVLPSHSKAMTEAGQARKPLDANFIEYEVTHIARERVEGDSLSVQPLEIETPAKNSTWDIPWFAILVGVSSCGTLILVASSLVQVWRVSRTLRRATSDNVRLQGLVRTTASRMALQGIPVVYAVDAPIAPFLWVRSTGPVIVLPTTLVDQLSDQQITCILCHELAHYVRLDHWSNTFAFLVAALFWWLPVAWWAKREMRAAQEVCCDGIALARGAATRRCYAETLFQVLEFIQTTHPTEPALVCGFGRNSSMKRRFEMIASLQFNDRFSWRAISFVAACVVALFCVPVSGQPQTPQQPQTVAQPQAVPRLQESQQTDSARRLEEAKRLLEEVRQLEAAKAALPGEFPATPAPALAPPASGQSVRPGSSDRISMDYKLSEKEAERLVVLVKTFGHEEIDIWGYDQVKGTATITAPKSDHQLITAVLQLLLAAQDLAPRESGKDDGKVWPRLGMTLEPGDASQIRRINPTLRGGLKVVAVRPESPAAKLGVREGDVVIGLAKWETVSLKDVDWVLDHYQPRDGQPINILTLRNAAEGATSVVEPPAPARISRPAGVRDSAAVEVVPARPTIRN